MGPQPHITDPRIHVDLAHLRALEKHARAISFLPRQPARSILNGRHASRLRGRGLNFEELRNYHQGDDVRTIDWKVTARTGEPHVRVYTEERDRPALLLVDQRMSMFYGSVLNMKSVTAAEAAALAAWRLRLQGDRVGGLIFSDTGLAELPPRASGRALNRFLSLLAEANSALHAEAEVAEPLGLNTVLTAAARIAKTGMTLMIFSDFGEADASTESLVRQLAMHNDVLLFPVSDPTGHDLPPDFRLVASDGRMQVELKASSRDTVDKVTAVSRARMQPVMEWGRKYGVPVLPLDAGQETMPQLRALLGAGGR